MKFKAACIQINCKDNIKVNIEKTIRYIREAAAAGADFITLPENAALIVSGVNKYGREKLIKDGQLFLKSIKAEAKKSKCWILIGSILVPATKNKFYNRSFLIDDKGNIAAKYDKIHLFDVILKNGESHKESAKNEYGKKAVITKTPWGKLGMTVCYDLRFPHLFRHLAEKGAYFITVPAAFTYYTGKAHWHTLLKARAIENTCYIIAPAQVGTHPGGRKTYGHSLIIDPWGKILADGMEKEGVITASIDTKYVKEIRGQLPSLKHTRTFN